MRRRGLEPPPGYPGRPRACDGKLGADLHRSRTADFRAPSRARRRRGFARPPRQRSRRRRYKAPLTRRRGPRNARGKRPPEGRVLAPPPLEAQTGRCAQASAADAAQPDHRRTSITITGPSGARSAYWPYLRRSAVVARSCSFAPSSALAISATPSARTHQSLSQSSSYQSARTATRGSDAMFASRLSASVRFGLSSTAETIVCSPRAAKVIGTRCGHVPTVASRATRADQNRSSHSAFSTGLP
jgi:hypothetical protein